MVGASWFGFFPMSLKIVSGAAAAALLAAAAQPALAHGDKDGVCIWDRLPKKETKAAIDAGLAGGVDAMSDHLFFADVRAAAEACGFDASDEESSDLSNAAHGLAMQKLAEAWFMTHLNIAPDRLDGAWDRMGEYDQSIFLRAMRGKRESNDSLATAENGFETALKLTKPIDDTEAAQLQTFVTTYVSGRALRAVYEPKL